MTAHAYYIFNYLTANVRLKFLKILRSPYTLQFKSLGSLTVRLKKRTHSIDQK